MFGGTLWEMLIKEAGATHEEQSSFIEENIVLVSELVEGDTTSKRHAPYFELRWKYPTQCVKWMKYSTSKINGIVMQLP